MSEFEIALRAQAWRRRLEDLGILPGTCVQAYVRELAETEARILATLTREAVIDGA